MKIKCIKLHDTLAQLSGINSKSKTHFHYQEVQWRTFPEGFKAEPIQNIFPKKEKIAFISLL